MEGSFEDNNVSVTEKRDNSGKLLGYTYTDEISGNSSFFALGVNPFTGRTHNDVEYGTFSNGYQPDNVNGNKLSKVKGPIIEVNGNNQSLWYDKKNKKYYYWDGRKNSYFKLTEAEKKAVGIK
jgi:hypothetical protein